MNVTSFVKIGFLAGAAAGAYGIAVTAVGYFEAEKSAAVAQALKSEGLDWAEARTDGMQIVLSGTAPTEAARFRAIAAAARVTDPANVRDRMAMAEKPAAPQLAYEVEILRNSNSVLVHGLVPAGPGVPVDLLARVRSLGPDIEVSDVLTQSVADAPATWAAATDLGLSAVARLPDARVEITPASVSVEGVAPPGADAAELTRSLEAAAPEGITVTVNLRQPRQRLTPFDLRIENDGEGLVLSSCAVESAADAERVSKALMAAGGIAGAGCRVGLGAPDAAWPEAAEAAIASLAALGRGAITISETSVTVLPDADVPPEVLAAQSTALRQALPEGYQVSLLATKGLTIGEDGPHLHLSRAAEGPVTLQGPLAGPQDEAVLASLAAARFGGDQLTRALTQSDGLPADWRLRALAATEALALLAEGEVDMSASAISVTGRTLAPDGEEAIRKSLTTALGSETSLAIDVSYDHETAQAAAGPATSPQACVSHANAVLLERKIVFAPGSVELDASSSQTVDQLASILRDCPGVAMEIGGHTDSQGGAEMNTLLSQARADAVLAALSERKVVMAKFSAKGYGESQPIADNSTEVGREANRRIAFRLTSP